MGNGYSNPHQVQLLPGRIIDRGHYHPVLFKELRKSTRLFSGIEEDRHDGSPEMGCPEIHGSQCLPDGPRLVNQFLAQARILLMIASEAIPAAAIGGGRAVEAW